MTVTDDIFLVCSIVLMLGFGIALIYATTAWMDVPSSSTDLTDEEKKRAEERKDAIRYGGIPDVVFPDVFPSIDHIETVDSTADYILNAMKNNN